MCIYKHCFLPMLLVFAMKYTKMPCPLPHNHYCCLLPSPICLRHLFICACLISSPIACLPSSVLCWCLLRFFIFAICYISLWLHFRLFVYMYSLFVLFFVKKKNKMKVCRVRVEPKTISIAPITHNHYTTSRAEFSWPKSDLFLSIASCHGTKSSTGGTIALAQWFLTGGTRSQSSRYEAAKSSGIHALEI